MYMGWRPQGSELGPKLFLQLRNYFFNCNFSSLDFLGHFQRLGRRSNLHGFLSELRECRMDKRQRSV